VEHDFFCKGLRPKEIALAERTATGKVQRPAFYAKSNVASAPWPAEGLAELVAWVERRQRDRTLTPTEFSEDHTVGKVLIEPVDAAVSEVGAGATAFVHRDALFITQYQSRWHGNAGAEVEAANVEWANGLYAAVEPWRSGSAYQNYIDAELDDW